MTAFADELPTRPDTPRSMRPPMSNDEKTPGDNSAVSVRIERSADGAKKWRAHVPVYLLVAIGAALNGGACSSSERVERKVDDLIVRVSRLEGRLEQAGKVVANEGAEGAGGTSGI